MDAERFDGLVRTFSQTRSRRQTLRGLAGATVGVLALGGREASADKCKRTGKACKKNSQCCSNNCVGASGGKANDGTCQPNPQGTCAAGEDICQGDLGRDCNPAGPVDGDLCLCNTTADGATVCTNINSSTCDILDCEHDADCAPLGASYVCIAAAGCGGCFNGTTNRNACARLCD